MRYFWVLPVLIGSTGMLLLPNVLHVCFLIPLLLGTVLTIVAGRFRLAAAWVGLVGLGMLAVVSGWAAGRPNVDEDTALGVVASTNAVTLWLFLFIGFIVLGQVNDRRLRERSSL